MTIILYISINLLLCLVGPNWIFVNNLKFQCSTYENVDKIFGEQKLSVNALLIVVCDCQLFIALLPIKSE